MHTVGGKSFVPINRHNPSLFSFFTSLNDRNNNKNFIDILNINLNLSNNCIMFCATFTTNGKCWRSNKLNKTRNYNKPLNRYMNNKIKVWMSSTCALCWCKYLNWRILLPILWWHCKQIHFLNGENVWSWNCLSTKSF